MSSVLVPSSPVSPVSPASPSAPPTSIRPLRIVMTGGPGGGKTTAADFFRREYRDHVILVPEAATLLFQGGFPRHTDTQAVCATQRAIFRIQQSLEEIQTAMYPSHVLLCDRGTLDGAAYWPHGIQDFFAALQTSLEAELSRYDAVIFFESAAVGGSSIEGGNPARIESLEQAISLDLRLRTLWQAHPRFFLIPHSGSFFAKISEGLKTLRCVLTEILGGTLPTFRP